MNLVHFTQLEMSSLQRFWRPAPQTPAPPQTPNPGAKAVLLPNKPAVPANTAAVRDNEVSVARVEVPALRKKEETVTKKAEEAAEVLGKSEESNGREGKSLVNTFPFNQRGSAAAGHHDHHHDHGLGGLVPPPAPAQSFLAPASSRNEFGSKAD